jgi:hypothetical protein
MNAYHQVTTEEDSINQVNRMIQCVNASHPRPLSLAIIGIMPQSHEQNSMVAELDIMHGFKNTEINSSSPVRLQPLVSTTSGSSRNQH